MADCAGRVLGSGDRFLPCEDMERVFGSGDGLLANGRERKFRGEETGEAVWFLTKVVLVFGCEGTEIAAATGACIFPVVTTLVLGGCCGIGTNCADRVFLSGDRVLATEDCMVAGLTTDIGGGDAARVGGGDAVRVALLTLLTVLRLRIMGWACAYITGCGAGAMAG